MKTAFNYKTALVHDWLVQFAGAEKVLEAIYERFPSEIFTLVADPRSIKKSSLKEAKVQSSFIQKLPHAVRKYNWYLPLFPIAIEHMDLQGFDVVISSSHCVAKGALVHPEQLHVCYCHTPVRYGWDLYHNYLEDHGLRRGVKGVIAKTFLHYLRNWDLLNSNRVDLFVANSHFVKNRIERIYGKPAVVINPPVDVDLFSPDEKREEYFVAMSRLVPYKKMDLIVEAFNQMPDKKLIVIGSGPQMGALKKIARSNIELLGYQSDEAVRSLLQKAKAFVFGALEDFGIVPVEAMAAGCPVIAYGKGGILDSVEDQKTGLFFDKQDVRSIVSAVKEFEKKQDQFDPHKIAKHAQKFSKQQFQKQFVDTVENQAKAFFNR